MNGLRRERIEEGERVNYLLDGLYVICEFSDSGNVLREYVPGVSVSIGGSVYFYHYDRLGSVRFISDSSGNVVSEYVYDVWGNLVSSSGSVSQPYEFVGREGYYREGELYLLGQRWYDSSVGRFISRDPIGEEGGVNLYVYVGNNPVKRIDPEGLYYDPQEPPCHEWERKRNCKEKPPDLIGICVSCCVQRFRDGVATAGIREKLEWLAWFFQCRSTCGQTGGIHGPDAPTP